MTPCTIALLAVGIWIAAGLALMAVLIARAPEIGERDE